VDESGIGLLQREKDQGKESEQDEAGGQAQGEKGFSFGMFRVQEGVAFPRLEIFIVKGVLAAANEFRVIGVPIARIDLDAPFHRPGRCLGTMAEPEPKDNVLIVPL
jgi:hypothetical protein